MPPVFLVRPPGFGPGSPAWEADAVDYGGVRDQLFSWMRNEEYSETFVGNVKSYLERYVTGRLLRNPLDVISVFAGVKRGERHVALALRTLFNFYEVLGG